jgi:hypothetical protein
VEQATEPVRERLLAWSKLQSPQGISSWELPELIHAVDADFTAGRKRSSSPRYTGYWYIEGLRPSAGGNPPRTRKKWSIGTDDGAGGRWHGGHQTAVRRRPPACLLFGWESLSDLAPREVHTLVVCESK